MFHILILLTWSILQYTSIYPFSGLYTYKNTVSIYKSNINASAFRVYRWVALVFRARHSFYMIDFGHVHYSAIGLSLHQESISIAVVCEVC